MKKPRSRYHHGSLKSDAIEAAARELDAHGHQGFKLERVAKALGVTPAALYRHFANREELLQEVVWTIFLRFVERFDAVACAPNEPTAVLHAAGMAYVQFALENPGWFRLQFSQAGHPYSTRQNEANPKYVEPISKALTALTGAHGPEEELHFLLFWASMHGIASMSVERVIPTFTTDEQWLGVANELLTRMIAGFGRAKPARPKRR